jgi:hypothetical protein
MLLVLGRRGTGSADGSHRGSLSSFAQVRNYGTRWGADRE